MNREILTTNYELRNAAHFSNIFKRFTSFFEYFQTFRTIFRIFSNVFERFYPAYLAESPHFDTPTFIFTSKTNITPQINPKKSPFFSNSGYFQF